MGDNKVSQKSAKEKITTKRRLTERDQVDYVQPNSQSLSSCYNTLRSHSND
jgi:hypothetical protein